MGKRGGALLLLLIAVSGCSTKGFVFRTDASIRVAAPAGRARVVLPVTVAWTDDRRLGPDERYGVFIDRTPMRPGRPVVSMIDEFKGAEKTTCRTTPGCPDPQVLLDRGIVLTGERTLKIEFLGDKRANGRGDDPHEVTIVRMRGDERVGEAAFRVSFFVKR
jgi:hypothetical protein